MTLFQRLRMTRGLQWQGKRPSLAEMKETADEWLVVVGVLASLLLAYGVVGRMDYEEDLRQEAVSQAAVKEQYQAAVLACLNHGAILFDREELECRATSLGMVR